MSDDLEKLVRHSLDSVDRSKRLAMAVTVMAFVVILFVLATGLLHTPVGDPGGAKLLFASIAAQMIFVGLCTALLAMHVSRMTKAVLRAIELASSRGSK